MPELRRVVQIHRSEDFHWVGDGFPVKTIFAYNEFGTSLSPFLLMDYAEPKEFPPLATGRRGVGEHPHRGFETVTLVYQGEVEHRDSAGNRGKITMGDVQWMTASSGVVHEEMHSTDFTRRGGTMEMVQLWVNLPAEKKMDPPRYQEITSKQIPLIPLSEGRGSVRVIAGAYGNVLGPAKTFTPLNLWDLRLIEGKKFRFDWPETHSAALFVLRGELLFDLPTREQRVRDTELVLFEKKGTQIEFAATQDTVALLLGGVPIEEPIVGYGPFVMNTQAQIRQAISDFQSGVMGRLTNDLKEQG